MSTPPSTAPVASTSSASVRVWQTAVLEGILRGSLFFWFIALAAGINNVLNAYRNEAHLYAQPLWMAGGVIGLYVAAVALNTLITFNRRLTYAWRAGVLLFTFYAIGVTGLALSALSGDGRIFLFAFVALSALLFDWRASLSALALSVLTLLVVGGLGVSGFIVIPAVRQLNAADAGAWLSGGVVFVLLGFTVLISTAYLMRHLTQSLAEAQRRASQLTALHHIGLSLSAQHELSTLLQLVVDQAAHLLGHQMGSLYLLQPDGRTLELKVVHHLRFDTPRAHLQMGQGLTGRVAQNQQPLMVDDYPAWPGRLPELTEFAFRSVLGMPIVWQGQLLGVLNLHDPRPHYFKPQDVELAQLLAHEAAVAIANTRHLAETAEALAREQRLRRIIRAVSEINQLILRERDRDRLLQEACALFVRERDYTFAWVGLLNADGLTGRLVASAGQAVEPARFDFFVEAPERGPICPAAALRRNELVRIGPGDNDSCQTCPLRAEYPQRSAVTLPLRRGARAFGILSVVHFTSPDIFNEEELGLLQELANDVAYALESLETQDTNARLLVETQAKATELGRLNAAARDLSASLELQTVLNNLVRHMTEALNATSSYISGYAPEHNALTVLAEYWSEAAPFAERTSDLGLVMSNVDYPSVMPQAMRGEAVTLHAETPGLSESEQRQFVQYGVQSMLFVPLMARGQFLGNAEVWESRRHREFLADEIRLAQALAAFAAGAIANARLFETERRHVAALTALHQIGLDLSTQRELNSLLAAIIDRAMQLLGASMGALYLLRPDEPVLELVIERGTPGAYLGTRLALGEGASGKAAQTGEPLLIGDYHTWAGRAAAFHSLPAATVIAAPLKWQGQVIGVINVNDVQPYHYGASEVEIVSLFADQAAVAIENARLFQKLEEREAYYRALTENAAEGIMVVDGAGIARYQSPALRRILGYAATEFTHQAAGLIQWVHPEDRPRALMVVERALKAPQAAALAEIRVRHANGNWRWLALTAQSMLGDERIGGVVINYRDITERKQTEMRRAILYETLRSVGASLDPEAIVQAAVTVIAQFSHWLSVSISLPSADGQTWATRARMAEHSGAMESVHPIHAGVVGRAYRTGATQWVPDALADPDYLGEARSELAVPIKRGAQVLGVINLEDQHPNAFTLEDVSLAESLAEVVGLALENGRLYAVAQRELAERTHAQTALASANAELQLAVSRATLLAAAAEKANRLKNEIFANTSHELRTPLVGILGALDIVLNDMCDSRAEEKELQRTALTAAQRLLTIVNQLLAAAQLDSQRMELRLEPLAPGPLLQTICAQVRPLADHKRLTFALEAPPTLPAVWADEEKVALILWHILENAFKFTATGGVTVRAHTDNAHQQLSITVTDTGIGLTADKQADLFQSFMQGDAGLTRQYGGLGLGLSMAHQIAELMGGALDFYSAGEGQGASVTLRLRLA